MNYKNEERLFIGIVIAGLALLIGGVIFGVRSCESTRCGTLAEEMKLEHTYSMISGCRVKLGERTVPLGQVRFFEDGKIRVEEGD